MIKIGRCVNIHAVTSPPNQSIITLYTTMVHKPFDFWDKHEYHHGFCECYKDPLGCILGWFVPCCFVGKVAADLAGKGSSFDCISCLCAHIGVYRNRKMVQARDNIHESEHATILAATMCAQCSICQDGHQAGYLPHATAAPIPQTEAPTTVVPPADNQV